ncbi:MAG: anaerobic ribonucleoside-triphosphate reductase activating protein [Clostridium sp.]|nr:anaerobic ribonucleoside-triphosphate reductase activating protein [Clostridium sp.]
MNYSAIKKTDIANGVGVRVSLFVSGCTHHCKGCFNEETWDFNAGNLFTEEISKEIIEALSPNYISGLTLIGGEPLEIRNQPEVYKLVYKVKKLYPEKNIWCYSGYTFESDILDPNGKAHCDITDKLISMIDILVDGEFMLDKKNITLKFRGSENQRIIDVRKSLEMRKTVLSEFMT